jgi:hypothetical protein
MTENPCLKYCERFVPGKFGALDKDCVESCKILEVLLKDFIKAIEFECRLRYKKYDAAKFCLDLTLSILIMTINQYLDYILKKTG